MTGFAELLFSGLMSGLIIGLAGLAVTLVFGIARFSNAATGDTMTLGAYGALVGSAFTGSVILGSLIGLAAGALASVVSYLLVFRPLQGRSPISSLLASIGLAFFIRAIIGLVFGHDQNVFQLDIVRPIKFAGIRIQPNDLKFAAVAISTLAVVFIILHLTPIGRRMRAVADNPLLAKVSGISPRPVMLALWSIAGAVSAIAGIILGMKTVVSPESGWEMLLPAFAAAVLGGIGHPIGAIVGGLLIGVAQELATPFVGFTYKIAVSFIVLLLVLLIRPKGLFGRSEGVR
ncbi:branched-chain amino acid ABC transporter permease [Roseibium suaedae]|uniref:Branched-chain amino acid transport system permease protein n=1 Tax=Roseibium suaedae TaxID=735517 RepID=A0A1M7HZ56_9HYPH|nr:branched-chain amino acid ABC transporter permease [Roseibium suaedae]SHM33740.1 branched-chain amino acid transport system permease protein [Roseibium suaedae]